MTNPIQCEVLTQGRQGAKSQENVIPLFASLRLGVWAWKNVSRQTPATALDMQPQAGLSRRLAAPKSDEGGNEMKRMSRKTCGEHGPDLSGLSFGTPSRRTRRRACVRLRGYHMCQYQEPTRFRFWGFSNAGCSYPSRLCTSFSFATMLMSALQAGMQSPQAMQVEPSLVSVRYSDRARESSW